MRISDWSSDVCSSCFFHPADDRAARTLDGIGLRQSHRMDDQRDDGPPRYRDQPDVGASAKRREEPDRDVRVADRDDEAELAVEFRSEARRRGEEGDSTCRSRWSPAIYKKQR